MPKLYDYFGLRVYFYANDHEPVHVHGFYQGRESKAELVIVNGSITGVRILRVAGMRPLTGKALADFELLVSRRAGDIVDKWVEFFVHHRTVRAETITRKLK
ncbi:MAG TPA: DUF4160 domain-containing protein [Candidatus Binatia bacterium]|jgi:hypothetical protein|nr:DUF4160 domain-containing protein [Candidatus Binatia bacterium]